MQAVTQARLGEVLSYDPETGEFRYRTDRGRCRKGRVAGGRASNGYIQIKIDYRNYLGHRLAWLAMTGQWPTFEIDHANGVKDDNRWANLRRATHSENAMNRPKQSNNTSGFKGVNWAQSTWQARICAGGVTKYLGSYPTREEAHKAYTEAAAVYHGDFCRTQ